MCHRSVTASIILLSVLVLNPAVREQSAQVAEAGRTSAKSTAVAVSKPYTWVHIQGLRAMTR